MGFILYYYKMPGSYKLLPLFCASLLLSGCPNPAAYREPITRFQQASTVVIEGARLEYALANKTERNTEIDRLVAKKSRIDLSILNDPAIRVLDPDSLNARMVALDALAKHGQLLLTLSSSDAPARAKDAANSLDDAVVGLSSSLGRVPSDQFKNAAEGFATLAGEAAKLALDANITDALNKAIVATENNVTGLLRLIREDLGDIYQRRRSSVSAARLHAADAYNVALKQGRSADELQKAAAEIKKVEDLWDSLPLLLGAGPGLDAMAQTHRKLVDYAKSPKNPQDLAELIDATDAFVTRAKVIADAIQTIQAAKE